MADDKRQLMRSLGFLSSLGISMVASSFIGLFIGYYLDKWLGTSPWMTLKPSSCWDEARRPVSSRLKVQVCAAI